MALVHGTRIGPYEIAAQIGVGGMGEVYRARDTKLKRDVALKILPDSFANDTERLERFQREAEVLASLNHPNIAHIHGLEESGGLRALVMELVEGEDIAERIARGPVSIDDALPIAKQIAEALEAAREQGVIHRDLKPANIKLRPNGTVKVLDFGLAKLARASDAGLHASDLSQSPTMMSPAATRMGVVMGTVAYMSPEQARGMPVDMRTDIWAFGCVLYEMLSGRPAFAGETSSDTIAKILEREPDWQALPSSTPTQIRGLLRRCLQKDRERRLQDISDARVEIEEAAAARTGSPRMVGLPVVAGGIGLALTLLTSVWWYTARSTTPIQHAPVSVVIADLQNRTNDPIFDRTLEPMLRIVLEGAGFISAYDRTRVRNSLGVRPPETLDEPAARQLAVQQGLGVVLSSFLDRQGSGYELSIRAVEAATGNVISNARGTASNRDRVLSEATRLVTAVRTALGDETSESAQLIAMRSISATSLEVVRHYTLAQEAASNNKFDEARQSALKAIELDPQFGIGYQLLAVASQNMGQTEAAERYIKEALRHLDGMTERERLSTRGMFYRLSGDYQQCVKEYGELIARYAADVVGRNQVALCASKLRDFRRAQNEMSRVVEILPKRALFRDNLALYANYAGDFQTGEREARTVQGPDAYATLALAFAQLGQGQLPQAIDTYQKLGTIGALGESMAASGLGDLATFEGRFSEAVRVLEQGAVADLTSKNADRAAAKFAAVAYTQILRGRKTDASTAAQQALANSRAVKIRFLAARTFADAGELSRARTLIAGLGSELQSEPQAYAKIVEAQIILSSNDVRSAIKLLTDANGLLDTWIGHFELGRAYLQAGLFAQADSEFDRCIKRRGEALSLFLDEEPTYGYFPSVYYYQGRAREGLNTVGFAESYRAYLRIREKAGEDPILAEVRRRAGL